MYIEATSISLTNKWHHVVQMFSLFSDAAWLSVPLSASQGGMQDDHPLFEIFFWYIVKYMFVAIDAIDRSSSILVRFTLLPPQDRNTSVSITSTYERLRFFRSQPPLLIHISRLPDGYNRWKCCFRYIRIDCFPSLSAFSMWPPSARSLPLSKRHCVVFKTEQTAKSYRWLLLLSCFRNLYRVTSVSTRDVPEQEPLE